MADDKIPEWDISPLVESTDSNDIKKELDSALRIAKSFEAQYKGRIAEAAPEILLKLYQDHDALWIQALNPYVYSYNSFSADASDSERTDLFEYGRNIWSEIESTLTFVRLESSKMLQERPNIVDNPTLSEFRHSLEIMREEGKHHLSEKEEQLILQKDRYGISAWSVMHEALRGSRLFEIEIDGEKRELGFMELSNLIQSDANRDNRREACRVLFEGLTNDRLVWSYALRSVFGDYMNQLNLRQFPDILSMSLLQNDIDRSVLDGLITGIRENMNLLRRYLSIKATILKLPKLAYYDLDASVSEIDSKITWEKARKLVIDSYRDFDEESGNFVDSLFENNRIDASIRPGKTGFGFCVSVPSLRTSWIMINFKGSLSDISVLAHEAGHGLHGYYASKEQGWTNFLTGSCLAESASIFGQLLLTDKLLSETNDDSTKISLLCSVIDSFRLLTSDMLVRYEFETNALNTLKNNENLDADKLDSLWTAARDEVYGNAIEWPLETKIWWAVPVHHYMPNYRFYNYPYAFGQLLVYALYGLYKKERGEFVPKLKKILSSGGSKSPKELLAEVGFDITDPKFWEIGFKQAEEFIDELEKLVG